MDHRIVCFMPSYNLFSQGYPFLEVIYSSLFVCDKMYIFDGSSDETSKILSMLRNERIKIARMEWNFTQRNTRRGEVIAEMSNRMIDQIIRMEKENTPKTFIYYIQANEVFHEDTYAQIRSIPDAYPGYRGYLLYYYGFYGHILRGEQFRLRMAPLSKNVRAIHDGWTLNVFGGFLESLKRTIRHEAGMLLRYGKLNDFLWIGNAMYRYVYTKKPIFRYSLIFRNIVAKKIQTHKIMFKSGAFEQLLDVSTLDNISDDQFWMELVKISTKVQGKGKKEFPQLNVSLDEHPKIMRDILGLREYKIRDEIVKEINTLSDVSD
ncbi:hypothetical protein [Metallosphaera sedula]|uniref:hypothetical protein n=1 Tax=Metallosphaera sedula TaxID=43687 RepID=UPI0020BD6E71|nr:hypothetical protein [Metallosphaera sedula]BBL47955.1 hypothetical protein MJ1HA_2070 [Metallosphaera sedula]